MELSYGRVTTPEGQVVPSTEGDWARREDKVVACSCAGTRSAVNACAAFSPQVNQRLACRSALEASGPLPDPKLVNEDRA